MLLVLTCRSQKSLMCLKISTCWNTHSIICFVQMCRICCRHQFTQIPYYYYYYCGVYGSALDTHNLQYIKVRPFYYQKDKDWKNLGKSSEIFFCAERAIRPLRFFTHWTERTECSNSPTQNEEIWSEPKRYIWLYSRGSFYQFDGR